MALVLLVIGACGTTTSQHENQEVVLRYDTPAVEWTQALPVGNGRLGAMVFGDPGMERLQLNEESVWCRQGSYRDVNGADVMPEVRRLLFGGKYREAQELVVDELLQERLPGGTNTYQTLGNLHIEYPDTGEVTGYSRALRLDSALVRTAFMRNGKAFQREVFSSAVDEMILFRETAEMGGELNCLVSLDRPGEGEEVTVQENRIIMKQHVEDGQGVRYEVRVQVESYGGIVTASGDALKVEGASVLEIRLLAATDYRGTDPEILCNRVESAAAGRTYEQILADHVAEYRGYFDRVRIDLGGSHTGGLPTDRRLQLQSTENPDPGLAALYFNFGRYLLISSSRPGNLPANLQGIWNESLTPPWNSDYHININIQMNYWPAGVTNLSECHLPFLYFIGELRENGRKTAATTYGCRGFVAQHTTDPWHMTQLFGSPGWGMWPMGAAWSATHIWDYYLFTGDTAFLRDYGYEVMREAALFLSDFLVEHPETGYLVTGPSISPENLFVTPAGDTAAINMGPAMDLQITWHLFTSVIAAGEVLDTDHEFRVLLQGQLEKLAPVRIGSDGRILEWSEEGLAEVEPGHRHMSHLYGLHPSIQYNWKDTPEYMEAARKVIEQRLEHGGGHTGWSRAWMINFLARLKDGEEAHHHLQQLLIKSTLPNLFDTHPPFQIDGNFGGTAGIAEMLLQSHAGYVEVLPALPAAWPEGSVHGLVARGGFEMDLEWSGRQLSRVRVVSQLGNPLVLVYGSNQVEKYTRPGQVMAFDGRLRPR